MEKYPLINKIKSPKDIKGYNYKELNNLAYEIRRFLLDKISKTGGHLASNLGVVEATIALHYVFDSPTDKLIFDVGHQGYVHKILTGRASEFDSLRQKNGLSGFLKYSESNHDVFEAGHSSTSISAMAGFLEAKNLDEDNKIGEVVSFVGDASFQSGISLAGLNYLASKKDQKGIIIINDNDMSISKNTGGMTNVFNNLRVKKTYKLVRKITPRFIRNMMKSVVYGKNPVFSGLGFRYIGPIDGHNLKDLIKYFKFAKESKSSIIVHIKTIKGKGYKFSEEDVIGKYHGVNPFDLESGKELVNKDINNINNIENNVSFSKIVGNYIEEILEKNRNVYVITPAMSYGVGLSNAIEKYKNRILDVGICEENAIIMASAMANCNIIPITMTYATFYQRAYDEINHDICRPNKHVIMLSDRAGIVPYDGDTHQGIFDLSMLTALPNLNICAPSNLDDFKYVIDYAISDKAPYYIRYPKVRINNNFNSTNYLNKYNNKDWIILRELKNINILSYGPFLEEIINKTKEYDIGIINALFIKPIDINIINKLNTSSKTTLIIYEEAINTGSLSMIIKNYVYDNNLNIDIYSFTLNNYVHNGSIEDIKNENKLGINDLLFLLKKLK